MSKSAAKNKKKREAKARAKQEQETSEEVILFTFACDFLEISDTQGKQLILFPRIAEGIKVYYFPEGPVIK